MSHSKDHRGPKPPIDVDAITVEDLRKLSREELDKVMFHKLKIVCRVKKCNHFTTGRDYGVTPWVFVPRFKEQWTDLTRTFFMCEAHDRWYERLVTQYGSTVTQEKILKPSDEPLWLPFG